MKTETLPNTIQWLKDRYNSKLITILELRKMVELLNMIYDSSAKQHNILLYFLNWIELKRWIEFKKQ